MATKKVTKTEVPPKLSRESKVPDGENEAKLERKPEATTMDTAEDSEVDYLQKYQYKKLNGIPAIGSERGALTNPERGSKAEAMKKFLLAQPRVRVMVPVDSGTDPSVPFDVCLNGYRLSLPRNQYIDVPEQVADVIMNSHSQTTQAINQFRVGGDKAREDALSG